LILVNTRSKCLKMTVEIASFYKFADLPRYREMQGALLDSLTSAGVKGSILLAEEGLNGTIAAPVGTMTDVISMVSRITEIGPIDCKHATAASMPFKRMKVRLKKEIVTIGNVRANPTEVVGTYVEPQDWNKLIADPETIVIDTRNAYEFRIGTFKNSIDPSTENFSQFPDFVRQQLADKKGARIAMFCTGGIRCEKATSFMKYEGFENVYHLKGGILKYLELIPRDESLWQGDCFVFDERIAVGHGHSATDVSMCFGCLEPVSAHERLSPLYEDGVSCPRCAKKLSDEQKKSNRERQKQVNLAAARQKRHLGPG
jgi:UPF0176 protein